VLTNWEPLVMLAARLRERWGLPGMSAETVRGFRDKQVMKERLGAAGLRVPRSRRVRTAAEARAAADEVGFPLILKPIAGAGCADTYRVDDRAELDVALGRMGNVSEASCEEYVEGDELTFDTVCMRGKPMIENVALYLPKPLEASTTEWVSPIAITLRDLTQPDLAAGLKLGRAALEVLGMQDGFTHMEWYRTPSGEAVFGEIACRPGGAGLVDLMNYTCDTDLFREWARVSCWGYFEGSTERKYNVGVVFKRAQGWGNITRIDGLHEWLHACGPWVVEERLSRPGTPRKDWRQSQRADGHVIVRHPDFAEALRMCQAAASGIQIRAQ
jgi:biotin carboxylase